MIYITVLQFITVFFLSLESLIEFLIEYHKVIFQSLSMNKIIMKLEEVGTI
jgi:hypothetical protein